MEKPQNLYVQPMDIDSGMENAGEWRGKGMKGRKNLGQL